MSESNNKASSAASAAKDVKQLGVWAALASLSYVFWVVGGMEMIERLAYYGVKATATIYAKDPVSQGGLGITMTEFSVILTVWAFLQSGIPVLTGGLSDRFGYKETIFVSTLLKISGYLVMAWFPTYDGFFCGAILLAIGTGVFKPGIQGTLVKSTNRTNSSMAWGVFYQTVNIGGFLGPLVAASLRQFSWDKVFYACAAMIALNLILLLIYKEPGKDERVKESAKLKAAGKKRKNLISESLAELANPVLLGYLILFSGFWYMFNSLFDVLPAFIDDWVDTSTIVTSLFGSDGTQNSLAHFFLGMDKSGTYIKPEGLMNVNAGMIMLTCFLFAGLSARMKAIDSIVLGTLLCSGGFMILGSVNYAWFVALAIIMFSVGEMLSSPKFLEFLGNMAPADKKGMYLGFSQLPMLIGWPLESWTVPRMYDMWASKDILAREYMVSNGADQTWVDAIPNGEAIGFMADYIKRPVAEATQILYQGNDIGLVWYIMALAGFLSAVGFFFYGRYLLRVQQAK